MKNYKYYVAVNNAAGEVKIKKILKEDLKSIENPNGWTFQQLFGSYFSIPWEFDSKEEAEEFCKKEFSGFEIYYLSLIPDDMEETKRNFDEFWESYSEDIEF